MLEPYVTRIQSVTELTRSIKGLLENAFPFVTVAGEISNLKRPHSGHLYFTLKDQESQIRAVMFKTQQRYLAATPKDGLEVICRGRVSVYEPRGEYQLIVDYLDQRGKGLLQLAFEELKKKLADEGLFDESHKKPLPFLPECIALVTSPDGAAVHDFLKMANSRFPGVPIKIFPVRVQGEGAAEDVIGALSILNERAIADVIVLCRGGGSLEDLWAFNEEKVARAIYASRIPVVSAIGHEVDFTIADFVADYRAPTPTAAAEAVLPDKKALKERVFKLNKTIATTMVRKIAEYRSQLATFKRLLGDPSSLLDHYLLRLDHLQTRMIHALSADFHRKRSQLALLSSRLLTQDPTRKLIEKKERVKWLTQQLATVMAFQLERKQGKLQRLATLLDAVSPLSILARGYAIAKEKPSGIVIRNAAQVKKGDAIQVLLHKGKLDCEVTKTEDA